MTQSSFYLFFPKKSQISKTVNFPCATYITDWPQVSAFFFFLTNIWHYWDCNILRVIQQILFLPDITKGYMLYYNQADFFLFLFSIHLLTILFLVMMGNVLLVFPESCWAQNQWCTRMPYIWTHRSTFPPFLSMLFFNHCIPVHVYK